MERAALAAGEAAVVEDIGDLGVGVLVEQVVDGGDDLGWGLAQQPGWFERGRVRVWFWPPGSRRWQVMVSA